MAKTQSKEIKKFEFSKVGSILDNIAKTVPILVEKEIKEKKLSSIFLYLFLGVSLLSSLIGLLMFKI